MKLWLNCVLSQELSVHVCVPQLFIQPCHALGHFLGAEYKGVKGTALGNYPGVDRLREADNGKHIIKSYWSYCHML